MSAATLARILPAQNVQPPEPAPAAARPATGRVPLGQILLEMGAITPGNLLKALALRNRQEVRLGDILQAHGWVSETDLMAALARQWGAAVVDLLAERPDPRLIDGIGTETCLRHAMVPWRRIGATTVIATARPEDFVALCAALPPAFGPYAMVLAPERDVHASLIAQRQTAMIRRAETRVAPQESCRTRDAARASRVAMGAMAAVTLGLFAAPVAAFTLVFAWAVLVLVLGTALKTLAFAAELRGQVRGRRAPPTPPAPMGRLPIISVMVPLFHERDIATRLIKRLGKLTYPRELLDILLVVEEDDTTTRETLAQANLPRWMRVVSVPRGPIKTKPRALNYALNYCRGSIIGVYDAEDAPDPDQLHIVARRFAETGPEVACLQGILDYYNPRTNWLARCFTIEYAAWFRAMLPGLARLGLVVPLGGTTLFFRRDALEALGGWDAHNVTEDADLGIRLVRHGYRTELIPTVTGEEANCRALPWVKQRSRWLKGYAMTWGVHMRDPVRLWRDLGAWRFLGFQVQFLGGLSQYLLSPILWSFWAIPLGLWHPLQAVLSQGQLIALGLCFIAAEVVNITVGLWAVRGRAHRHLIVWVPTLHFYFPLGALAGWKAIYEVVAAPFYWDKTCHGVFDATPHPVATASALVPAIAAAAAPPPAAARIARAPLID
ncbi:glycosyltransferase [Pontitalea aquivivens]|uniref:glycosyltransferase n=1 Tax=Pontitalea aquivivens TaxID=3388663 RepID=UPI003970C374